MTNPKLIFYTACVVALMSTIGIALPYPILAPIFIDGAPGAFNHFLGLPPKLLLGLVLAINPFGVLLGSMIMGMLSDRFGRRRVLMMSLAGTFLGYVASAVALHQGWYLLFVLARFVTGLTEGNVAVLRAIIADLHPQLDRTRSFAVFNSWLYAGWLLGPLAGGAALPWGSDLAFWLAAGMILVCSGFLWLALPATVAQSGDAASRQVSMRDLLTIIRTRHALALLKNPALKQVFWLHLSITLAINGFYEFYPLWLVEFGQCNSFHIALTTAALCLTMSLASSLFGKFGHQARPLSQARLHATGIALLLMVQPWLPKGLGVAAIVLTGIPISMYNAITPAYFSDKFGAQGQGEIMGLLTTTFCLGNVIIALLGSVLTLLDTRLILLASGLCALATVVKLGQWIAGSGPLGHLALEQP